MLLLMQVGQGVVDKFNAARHNTAIKSAMGHPGLEKLVAREEEEKRRRKARLKVRAGSYNLCVCLQP